MTKPEIIYRQEGEEAFTLTKDGVVTFDKAPVGNVRIAIPEDAPVGLAQAIEDKTGVKVLIVDGNIRVSRDMFRSVSVQEYEVPPPREDHSQNYLKLRKKRF